MPCAPSASAGIGLDPDPRAPRPSASGGRIAVIGAGAIGGTVASFLAQAGLPVEVAVKRAETREAIETRGLVVEGLRGRRTTKLRAVEAIEQLEGPIDTAFLAVKTFDTADAITRLKPKLAPNGYVVTLQNGITVDEVAAILGGDRVLGAVVEWGSTLLGPGHIEVTSKGRFMLGEPSGQSTPRREAVKRLLEHTYPVDLVEDIRGALYSKLVVNACVSTTGAITGFALGKMLADRASREVFLAIATEGVRVGRASHVRFYSMANGRLDLERLCLDSPRGRARGLGLLRRHLLLRLGGLRYGRLKSSMLQSLERKGRTEVDAMNGVITVWGRREGVPTPVNDALVRIVHEIETGARPIVPANLRRVLETARSSDTPRH